MTYLQDELSKRSSKHQLTQALKGTTPMVVNEELKTYGNTKEDLFQRLINDWLHQTQFESNIQATTLTIIQLKAQTYTGFQKEMLLLKRIKKWEKLLNWKVIYKHLWQV